MRARSKQQKQSFLDALWHASVTFRLLILCTLGIGYFFVKFPLLLLALLLCGLAYSICRIIKDHGGHTHRLLYLPPSKEQTEGSQIGIIRDCPYV